MVRKLFAGLLPFDFLSPLPSDVGVAASPPLAAAAFGASDTADFAVPFAGTPGDCPPPSAAAAVAPSRAVLGDVEALLVHVLDSVVFETSVPTASVNSALRSAPGMLEVTQLGEVAAGFEGALSRLTSCSPTGAVTSFAGEDDAQPIAAAPSGCEARDEAEVRAYWHSRQLWFNLGSTNFNPRDCVDCEWQLYLTICARQVIAIERPGIPARVVAA